MPLSQYCQSLRHDVEGETNELYCTRQAAIALKEVHNTLKQKGYLLVVYDAYRPQRAVDAFIAWRSLKEDPAVKAKYYPTLSKPMIFDLGYLAEKSQHSAGSTFDLTLIPIQQQLKPVEVSTRLLSNGEKIPFLDDNTVDMGSSFDLFHPISHHGTTLITPEQEKMRTLLLETMQTHGFQEIQEEWWHYSLKNSLNQNVYFDWVADDRPHLMAAR